MKIITKRITSELLESEFKFLSKRSKAALSHARHHYEEELDFYSIFKVIES